MQEEHTYDSTAVAIVTEPSAVAPDAGVNLVNLLLPSYKELVPSMYKLIANGYPPGGVQHPALPRSVL